MDGIKKVFVNTSESYEVLIGSGIIDRAGELIADKLKNARRAVIITDSNVDALYSERVKKSLKKSGIDVLKYTFTAGEENKSTETFVDILEWLASEKITRTDVLAALGGGVVGDITGFAASCYLRGVDFVQIPTTLLSAVDSSVGGKTAVDLKAGKNLAGAFYQPKFVICDTDTFGTLPEKEIACGYAEVIKYGILFDESFFEAIKEKSIKIDEIVEKSVIFKRNTVQKDEFDRGERKLLNLGHTAAHGIEKASGYSVSHGAAVAIGTVIATKIAENLGICEKGVCEKIKEVLSQYNLPTESEFSAEELYEAALSDKKRENDKITLVLPKKIGECVLYDTDVLQLSALFSEALKK